MALHLRKGLLRLPLPRPPPPRLRSISSSSSSPPDSPNGDGGDNESTPPSPPPPPHPPLSSFSSYFSDIKESLKSPPSPPRRIPDTPQPPPSFTSPTPAASLEEIRKHLSEFRLKASGTRPSSSPSSPPPVSFQELFKNNVLSKPGESSSERPERPSFDSIRESLRQFRPSPGDQRRPTQSSFSLRAFRESLKDKGSTPSILGGDSGKLPDSIFGKELREKKGKGEGEGEGEKKGPKTEFVKLYSYDELGEKLRRLRPDQAKKGGNKWFSLHELNERLAKLREMEEREAESRMGGVFWDLRDSLVRLKESENKKADMRRWSLIMNLGGQMTPTFMLKPPQEHLLENVE